MQTLSIVTKDYSGLISLEEAKKWLNVTGTQDDQLITSLINSSVAYAETYLNRTVGQNTYVMSMDSFSDRIYLMRPPVSTITRIEYLDTEGISKDFALENVRWNTDEAVLYLRSGKKWPELFDEPYAVKIYYSCNGMFQANDADDILDAIKMTISFHYDFRDDVSSRWRRASDNILAPHRIIPFN